MEDIKKRILEYVYAQKTVIFASIGGQGHPTMRPLTVAGDSPYGELWFPINIKSGVVKEIGSDGRASVFVADPDGLYSCYLNGEAELVTDPARKDEMWQNKWSRFWPEGPAAPDYALVRFIPRRGVFVDVTEDIWEEVFF
jgi:general stress protein 26